jgi:hypothetical protein
LRGAVTRNGGERLPRLRIGAGLDALELTGGHRELDQHIAVRLPRDYGLRIRVIGPNQQSAQQPRGDYRGN